MENQETKYSCEIKCKSKYQAVAQATCELMVKTITSIVEVKLDRLYETHW